MILEHVLITKAVSVNHQDESVNCDWHVTNKFIWKKANETTELFFRYALENEVSEDYENYGSTLGVFLPIVKDAIHIKELSKLIFKESGTFVTNSEYFSLA